MQPPSIDNLVFDKEIYKRKLKPLYRQNTIPKKNASPYLPNRPNDAPRSHFLHYLLDHLCNRALPPQQGIPNQKGVHPRDTNREKRDSQSTLVIMEITSCEEVKKKVMCSHYLGIIMRKNKPPSFLQLI